MDSAGFIGATPVLIEVKARVSKRMVWHEYGREGNLEYKIFRTIRDLYTAADTPLVKKLAAWDRTTPPELVFVAGAFADDALADLKELLARWGAAWRFGARVYRWDKGEATCLYAQPAPERVDPAQVQFPEMASVPLAKRGPKMTEGELEAIVAQQGLSACLAAMLAEMDRRGLTICARNQNNINYGKTLPNASARPALIGIWPKRSTSAAGLLVSVSRKELAQCLDVPLVADEDVLGAPGPERVGYLNCQRFLRSSEEVAAFWTKLAPKADSD